MDKETAPCRQNEKDRGYVTSAAFSPDFDSNIAIAMVSTRISQDEEYIEVLIEGEWRMAVCSTLPFTKAN